MDDQPDYVRAQTHTHIAIIWHLYLHSTTHIFVLKYTQMYICVSCGPHAYHAYHVVLKFPGSHRELLCRRSIDQKEAASRTKKSVWAELRRHGRLRIELLPELWPSLPSHERQSVLHYMLRFGQCCVLRDDAVTEAATIGRAVLLIPSLLPSAPTVVPVWPTKEGSDRRLRVCFITTNRHGPSDDWSDRCKFLPDTLFFRLVSFLVHDVRRVSDAFKDLYRDQVVVRTADLRYWLAHNR